MKTVINHRKTLALLLLYMSVGLVAGVGAIVFQQLLSFLIIYLMQGLTGYTEIKIVQGIRRVSLLWETPSLRVWLFPAIAGLGGLVTGLIVTRFAPEAAGHGTDEVIHAYHHKQGEVQLRVSIVKMIASAITLGSGGSGGKEGPIAQIGAGFGSFICTRVSYFRAYRKEIMLAGMAAGIAAIFRAPLAGAIFAAEILHSDTHYDGRVLIPAVIASSVSYGIYALFFGFMPVIVVPEFTYHFSLLHLIPYTIIGLFSALAAILFVKVFYGIRDLFNRISLPAYIKPAIGGILTGLVAIIIPESFGEGSFHLQRIVNGDIALLMLLVILFAKVITTSFSIGSGGSGGIFGPSLFIGATLGGLIGAAYAYIFPATTIPSIVFVLLGMVAFFAGAANAPFSTVIIVAEMTRTFTLLVPFLWVSMFGYIFSQRWNIYEKQVPIQHNILEIVESETDHVNET